ncbi:hypothetical protein OX612_002021 [Staphylococcus aureus]|nr:hypothetical protein [Staphylococcus aureus]EKF1559316.1 hypothetical protein [Staphylococcus aureus]
MTKKRRYDTTEFGLAHSMTVTKKRRYDTTEFGLAHSMTAKITLHQALYK